jgi:hypothetical protein
MIGTGSPITERKPKTRPAKIANDEFRLLLVNQVPRADLLEL